MPSLRAVVYACPLVFLTFVSCGNSYVGARCRGIGGHTDPASLPLGQVGAAPSDTFGRPSAYPYASREFGCCIKNPTFKKGENCGNVDCAAMQSRMTAAQVEGEFKGEPCGTPHTTFGPQPGIASCVVFMDDSVIVGVNAFCAD